MRPLEGLRVVSLAEQYPAANGAAPDTLGEDPGYGLFGTADGRRIALSIAFEDHFWRALCAAVDLPDLADVRGPERVARRDELRERLAERFATRDLAHWEAVLVGVPCEHSADALN